MEEQKQLGIFGNSKDTWFTSKEIGQTLGIILYFFIFINAKKIKEFFKNRQDLFVNKN